MKIYTSILPILFSLSCFLIDNIGHRYTESNIKTNTPKLRTDGYYYEVHKLKPCPFNEDDSATYEISIEPTIFYSNGSSINFRYFSSISLSSDFQCKRKIENTINSALKHFECYLTNKTVEEINKEFKREEYFGHGTYQLTDNKISIRTLTFNQNVNIKTLEIFGTFENDKITLEQYRDLETNKMTEFDKKLKLAFKEFDKIPELKNILKKN